MSPSQGVLGCPGARQLPGAPQRLCLAPLCCSQHEEKEKAFKEQLAHLASLLPTLQVGPWVGQGCRSPRSWAGARLPQPRGAPAVTPSHAQVHLVTCSAFLSSANKAEFLDLGYVSSASAVGQPVHPANVPWGSWSTPPRCSGVSGAPCGSARHPSPRLAAAFQQLMERLQRIVKLPHRLRPAQTSKVEPCRPPGAKPLPAALRRQPRLPALPRPQPRSPPSHPPDQQRVPGRVCPLPGAPADAEPPPLRGGQCQRHRSWHRRHEHVRCWGRTRGRGASCHASPWASCRAKLAPTAALEPVTSVVAWGQREAQLR